MTPEPTTSSRLRIATAAAGAIILALGVGILVWRVRGSRPNVLLITVDTLRADRLGAYGSTLTRTPNLDRLASQGTLFENASCPMPMTRPSLFSILTSRYPREHGVVNNSVSLPDRGLLLPEVFRAAGYRTAAFVGVQLLSEDAGFGRGFDRFEMPEQRREERAEWVIDRALAWIRAQDASKPLFVWIHLFDPHMPYAPPAPFGPPGEPSVISWFYLESLAGDSGNVPKATLERAIELYDGEIEYTDSALGKLFGALGDGKLLDRTIVAFTADHGECFSHGIYFEHSDCLYEDALHVPLILRHPGDIPAGARATQLAEHRDLGPTLLALAHVPAPATFGGHPLLPASTRGDGTEETGLVQLPLYQEKAAEGRSKKHSRLRSVAGEPTRPLVIEQQSVGLRSRAWKYIVTGTQEELYDLTSDPEEAHDLSASRPEVLARFRSDIAEKLRAHPLDLPAPSVVNDRLRATLHALGYVE